MMPRPGHYDILQISKEEYREVFRRATEWRSYIGYTENAKILTRLLGERIPISHDTTRLKSGDEMLIMRLRYRPKNKKALPVTIDEFDFFHAKYSNANNTKYPLD